MSTQEHWESVYASKGDRDLSWIQSEPRTSLSLIGEVCPVGRVIDVGGGTSLLAERLLDRGYSVTVLDISQTAIAGSPTQRLRTGCCCIRSDLEGFRFLVSFTHAKLPASVVLP